MFQVKTAAVVALVSAFLGVFASATAATAGTLTYTGSLADPNQILQIIFTVGSTSDVAIQTTSWKTGNFDTVLWLFDAAGNQVTKNDDSCNGVGCSPVDRDSLVHVSALPPGTYTAILSAWDQHFWRASPPTISVTGWSYAGGFFGLLPNYSVTMTTSTNIGTPFTQVIFPPSNVGPDAPKLISPANAATGVSLTASLNWNTVTGTNGYAVYLGTTYAGSPSTLTNGPPFTPATPLSPGTTYYWKVASRDPNRNNTENPSLVWSFTTAGSPPPPPPTQVSPASGTAGVSLTPTLTWNASSGSAGYDVYLGTTNPPQSVAVTNTLSFTPTAPLVAGATYYWKVASRDPNNNNAESSSPVWSFTTVPPAPALSVTKSHSGSFTQGQQNATYTVTVSNAVGAGSTSGQVTVTETVPAGLTLVSMAGTGWTCPGTAANNCIRTDALNASSSYPAITVKVNVTSNAASPQVNQVSVSGGGSLSASSSDSTVITQLVSGTNLALAKLATQSSTLAGFGPTTVASSAVDGNTDGNFSHGSVSHTGLDANAWWQVDLGATASISSIVIWNRTDCCWDRLSDYWVFVSSTPFSATDTPATLQVRAGTWNSHQTSFPNPATMIAPNVQGRYVRVQLNGTNYLSLAEVQVFGTFSAAAPASLSITKIHSGSFTQNQQNATYTVTVSNAAGAGPTSGQVMVTETVPAGLTLVSMAGTGWTCPGTAASNCIRTDALNGGASYPPITVKVNVASNAASPQVNQVSVSGGGSPTASSSDSTVIMPLVSGTNLAQGKVVIQSSTLSGVGPTTVASSAADGNTDGTFSHGSVSHTGLDANAWWQVDLGAVASISSIVIWNRTDCCWDRLSDYWMFVSSTPFSATDTPATLQVRAGTWNNHQTSFPNPSTTIAPNVQGRYVRVQLNGTNYLSLAEVQVFGTFSAAAPASLSITKIHSGSFTQGQQNATYTVTVSNAAGAGPTSGQVMVTETVPAGLTLVSMAGTGWTCPGTAANNCIRTDAMNGGASYPPITVTVNVTSNAASPQVNQVSVSGGGSLSANSSDSTVIMPLVSTTNLAQAKLATQSSTLAGVGATTVASSAVDGNTDGNFFHGSVSHTGLDANAWWQVDLGAVASISSVAIWNRTDCCWDRLSDYWVFISSTPFSATDTPATLQVRAGTWSSHQTSFPNPSTTIAPNVQGRYVRVQLNGTNYLSLAELQVFGTFGTSTPKVTSNVDGAAARANTTASAPAIVLPPIMNLRAGEPMQLPVMLTEPAQDDVLVTFKSSDPSIVGFAPMPESTPVVVAAGQTIPTALLKLIGMNVGLVTITASAPGYATATMQVLVGNPSVTKNLDFGQSDMLPSALGIPYVSETGTAETPAFASLQGLL